MDENDWYEIFTDPKYWEPSDPHYQPGVLVHQDSSTHRLTFTVDAAYVVPGITRIDIYGIPAPSAHDSIFEKQVNIGGVDDVEENPLIDKIADASNLADHVSGYLQLRRTYDMEYRGDPALETGDVIEVQVKYTNTLQKAYVLCNELSYNGAFRGKVTVKILDN